MADYKEKIRKLLALSRSPEEAEAKAALLKARELMAEHKLTEADVEAVKAQTVKVVDTGITYSGRRNPWVNWLSHIIADNYCCITVMGCKPNKQTKSVQFYGLEDDVEVCSAVFQYAVDCVIAKCNRIREERKRSYSSAIIKSHCDSYGYGFANGVKEAFKAQQEKHEEWGLALVRPKEVDEAVSGPGFSKVTFRTKSTDRINADTYLEGKADGRLFDPFTKLADGRVSA